MRKYLLGSIDPEMITIANLLNKLNLQYEYAKFEGNLCNPTNAYKADNNLVDYEEVVFIECKHQCYKGKSVFIDHHNEGDYGYKFTYTNFLEGASIGQLYKMLLKEGFYSIAEEIPFKKNENKFYYFHEGEWLININNKTFIVDKAIVKMAAIDHSIQDIYKDKCFGINKEEVFIDQLDQIRKKFFVKEKDFNKKKDFFIKILENKKGLIDLTHLDLGSGYTFEYILLREIALFLNKSIALKTKNLKEDLDKLMLIGLSEKQVESFLKEPVFDKYKISNSFGVPNRGYAGGFFD